MNSFWETEVSKNILLLSRNSNYKLELPPRGALTTIQIKETQLMLNEKAISLSIYCVTTPKEAHGIKTISKFCKYSRSLGFSEVETKLLQRWDGKGIGHTLMENRDSWSNSWSPDLASDMRRKAMELANCP